MLKLIQLEGVSKKDGEEWVFDSLDDDLTSPSTDRSSEDETDSLDRRSFDDTISSPLVNLGMFYVCVYSSMEVVEDGVVV